MIFVVSQIYIYKNDLIYWIINIWDFKKNIYKLEMTMNLNTITVGGTTYFIDDFSGYLLKVDT